MQGSVRKRRTQDGELRWDVTWDEPTADGRRRQRKKTFRTRKEAERFRTRTLHELFAGTYVRATTTTVAEYLEEWLEARRNEVEDSSLARYRSIVRGRLIPALGHVELAKLRPLTIQQCYTRLAQDGTGSTTLRLCHTVLRMALKRAVRLQLIPQNPAEAATPPKLRVPERPAWTAEEVRTFLAATADDRRHVLWRVGFDSGMRPCELLALAWADVDLERGAATVRRKLVQDGDGGWAIKAGAKSDAGRRVIALTPATVAALRAHRTAQLARRLRLGPAWHDLDLVFERGDGHHECHRAVEGAFDRAVKRAGLRRITPHGMRHTMATLMAAAGVHPKVVQERLGHSTVAMTLERYSHVSPDMQRDGADRLAAALDDPEPSVTSA